MTNYSTINVKPLSGNIGAEIDGVKCWVPLDPKNMDYAEIVLRKDAGTLTIKDAD